MPHELSIAGLRLLLAALCRAQPALPGRAGAAVARAARLRLSPAEADAEAGIDALRRRLAASAERVRVQDFGAGTRDGVLAAEARPAERAVAEIYGRAASGPAWGRFLFGLARGLRPARVLELGTNLGVSAAHLAAALRLNDAASSPDEGPGPDAGAGPSRLVTLEGDPGLAVRAREALQRLGHGPDRAEVVTGRFDDTLAAACDAAGPFGLVFVDGHHEEAAARRYAAAIRPHLAAGALVVLDDVEPGRPVRRAWAALRPEADAALYLGKLGLLYYAGPPRGPEAPCAYGPETAAGSHRAAPASQAP
ncbi:MAG: O-methyltransferase [Rubricoccaceae bacterium]